MSYRLFVIRLLPIHLLIALLVAGLPTVASAAPVAVLNGADVPLGEYTWVVGLAQADVADGYAAQFCGGTLIGQTWVLTAAHCTYDLDGRPFTPAALDIIVGSNRLSSKEGKRINVDKIIRHKSFQPTTLVGDIALLRLSQPAPVTPLSLSQPQRPVESNGTQATIVGWGVTTAGAGADQLQAAQIPLISQAACHRFYRSYGVTIHASMLCAGDATGQVDACVGDSGGPLLIWQAESQRWQQIGIISWGTACGTPGAYGVYTNLATFSKWIEFHTGLTIAA